ncbi:MAG: HupE/UreJ family protein [Pseudolabrys sp.]|nr:HupE/UreJ family protein [Pseudolabrys sp.]
MKRLMIGFGLALTVFPALAHHPMGGVTPATFGDGLLSGLGHPVIGLDHFAAVVAVGCLAAAHRSATRLVIGFMLAMMAGVALHLYGPPVPGAEIVVALSVFGLGVLMLTRRTMTSAAALIVFAAVGLLHGYVLGESIYGAEATPLAAYLLGLAVVQGAIALGAMHLARLWAQRAPDQMALRLAGAGIAGIGFALFVQQVSGA